MIIGFIGKKQSGKDTAASMWQYFYDKFRNTRLGHALEYSFNEYLETKYYYKEHSDLLSFAYPLKAAIGCLENITMSDIEALNGRDTFMRNTNITRRDMIKHIADKINADNPHYFIDMLAEKIPEHMFDNFQIIITDVRYKKEVEFIRTRSTESFIIKIIGKNPNIIDKHSSENDLNDFTNYDCAIHNNGTLEELFQNIYTIMTDKNFIQPGDLYLGNYKLGDMISIEYTSSITIDGAPYHFVITSTSTEKSLKWLYGIYPPNHKEISKSIIENHTEINNIININDEN